MINVGIIGEAKDTVNENNIAKTLRSGERLKICRSISINESILQKNAKNMKVLLLSGIVWH